MAKIIDGKAIAAVVSKEISEQSRQLAEKGIRPCLAVIAVGEDSASRVYLKNKRRACEAHSILMQEFILPEEASMEDLQALINQLNSCDEVHGIMLELPLPRHLNPLKAVSCISPRKDVDGTCSANAGKLLLGESALMPCTPAGVIELLKRSEIEIAGKNCVVLGRSNIVGKPIALLLLREDATVTICHTRTRGLAQITKNADIIVSAIGKAKFIKANMVKPGAVLIDIGMNRDENGKLCGDADFEELFDVCSYITPVPGGVGPMTVAMLMRNVLYSAEYSAEGSGV